MSRRMGKHHFTADIINVPSIRKSHWAPLCAFNALSDYFGDCLNSVLQYWMMGTLSNNALSRESNNPSSILDVVSLRRYVLAAICPHCQYEQRSGITRRVHVRLWNQPTENQVTHSYPHINYQWHCSASRRGGDVAWLRPTGSWLARLCYRPNLSCTHSLRRLPISPW